MTNQSASGAAPPAARVEAVADALYRLLPAHVRQVDMSSGGALRALFGVLALPSAEIDAETDAFYDALFVETAGESALPAIASLVGAAPLRPLPDSPLGQRAYIANTVRYRRGKGTARVLEALAADVSGLGAVVVEYFQRLSRLNHLIDVRPDRPGTATLVDGGTMSRAGSAFDTLPRLLDIRPISRARPGRTTGRHGITAVGIHLVRPVVPHFPAPDRRPSSQMLPPQDVSGVPVARPWVVAGTAHPGYFQLAAQPGAALRLFSPDRRTDAAGGRLQARDLADRLQRLPLHRETDELRRASLEERPARLPGRPWFDERGQPFTVYLRRATETAFTRVPPAQVLIANLETPPPASGARPAAELEYAWFGPGPAAPVPGKGKHPIACAVDPVTGRLMVAEPGSGASDVAEVRVAYGTGLGRAIGAGAQDRGDPDQPFEIRDAGGMTDLVWVVDPTRQAAGSAETGSRTVPSLAAALAEAAVQGAKRRSFVLLGRCDLEGAPGGASTMGVTLPAESEIHLVAAEWRAPKPVPGVPADAALRGFIIRRERRFTVDAPLRVTRGSGPATAQAGRLVLDGLELTQGLKLAVGSVSAVDLRYVTLRSPGRTALTATGSLPPVRISVDSSICGPIRLGTATTQVSGELDIRDSVVTADGAGGDTIAAPGLDCALCNVTVLGPSAMRALSATNTIFTAAVTVTRRQTGCVRYSFVPAGSATPRAFRCQPALTLADTAAAKGAPLTPDEAASLRLSVQPVLMDVTADEPALAMLHPLCPDAIRTGGEGECEMGAFARAAFGIATANLVSLLDDFLPVALEAGVIDDTRSAAVAARRNLP
ncbi:hypothetical protein [Micromonospora sp. SL4-19]|uniref:hypothetical protein n=1 Tax=Micromonospora sp. SL4-19 TaxID=3399129 RepID=UPI003A4E17ED